MELFIGFDLLGLNTRQIKLQTISRLKDLPFCYLSFYACYKINKITKNTTKVHTDSEQEAKTSVHGGSAAMVNGACGGREGMHMDCLTEQMFDLLDLFQNPRGLFCWFSDSLAYIWSSSVILISCSCLFLTSDCLSYLISVRMMFPWLHGYRCLKSRKMNKISKIP